MTRLTPHELSIARALAAGETWSEIAARTGALQQTLYTLAGRVYLKLGIAGGRRGPRGDEGRADLAAALARYENAQEEK